MSKNAVRWGADVGCQSKVKPLEIRNDLSDHGLKGKRAQGYLGLNRQFTKVTAKKDGRDGLPASDASTPDQWSECEQQIAERAEDVRRGLGTWLTTTAASVRSSSCARFRPPMHPCRPWRSGATSRRNAT